jgi:hypothetical protein
MEEVLKRASDAVLQETVTFEIDLFPKNGWHAFLQKVGLAKKKKEFSIRPLTLAQLQRISKLLLPINLEDLTTTAIIKLMIEHSSTCAHIVAIAVTESRNNPSKALVELFFNNLSKDDIKTALSIVLGQMHVSDFMISIASIRSLSTMQQVKSASAKTAPRKEVNPMTPVSQIAPGTLSAVS